MASNEGDGLTNWSLLPDYKQAASVTMDRTVKHVYVLKMGLCEMSMANLQVSA